VRAEEMRDLIAHMEQDRARDAEEERWDEEGLSEYERRRMRAGGQAPDLVGKRRRLGIRLEIGTDVRHAAGALAGFGFYRASRLARGTALVMRADYTTHDDAMGNLNAIAVSVGVTKKVLDTRRFEVAAGIAPRLELRYGFDTDDSPWNRGAIAGDFTLEMLPRALPASLGVRFNQTFTDDAKSTALLVELGFEVR
jgi:hypothetical protein